MTNRLIKTFIRYPEKTDDPATRTAYGRLAGTTGIVCNLLLFAAKLVIGILSASIAVTADAFNNLSDVAASVVALIGFYVAAKPPDEEHPFGHARFEYISGLAVAGLMLIVGFEFLSESVKKIMAPEAVGFSGVLVVTLVLACLVKLWLYFFYARIGTTIDSAALKATAKDARNDVITTLAVLLAMTAEHFTGLMIDGYTGVIVALLIMISSVRTAMETISPLLGETADPALVRFLSDKILAYDERIMDIHDLMVHDYGPGRRFASVHMEIDAKEDILETHELIDAVERMVYTEDHIQLLIHHDPVVTDDPVQNHLRRMITKHLLLTDERLRVHDFRVAHRAGGNAVVFDLVVPPELVKEEEEIRKSIRHLLDREEEKFELDITFDTQSFNQYIRKRDKKKMKK
ncbi:MAG: cation transporter [Lachnospiraceae bacterium]|nr:cation transporter [Lachnospiraceae bacterium]